MRELPEVNTYRYNRCYRRDQSESLIGDPAVIVRKFSWARKDRIAVHGLD